MALQVLDGRVDVRVGEDTIEIGAGEIAVVSPDHPWKAVAMTDGLLLLHLTWPPEPGSSMSRASTDPDHKVRSPSIGAEASADHAP